VIIEEVTTSGGSSEPSFSILGRERVQTADINLLCPRDNRDCLSARHLMPTHSRVEREAVLGVRTSSMSLSMVRFRTLILDVEGVHASIQMTAWTHCLLASRWPCFEFTWLTLS